MWFLVVTRQLSCFSAFADLHGLSSLTCCFYEYIRADAVNRFDLATQPRDIFFLYSFSKINFGRWPELTCGHWHQPRFWFQFELQFCSWFCCTTMIFFSAYFILFIFFVILVSIWFNTVSVHYHHTTTALDTVVIRSFNLSSLACCLLF